MATALRDAAASAVLQREALRFTCPSCDHERRPGARWRGSIPLRIRIFNSCVILDFCTIVLQRPGDPDARMLLLVAIDALSSLLQGWNLKGGTTQDAIEALDRGWCAPFGCPSRVYHDNALSFVSEEWLRWCGVHGILVSTSAAEAPWEHGRVERVVRVLRRALRATWRGFSRWKDATPERALRMVVEARNDLARTSAGTSPYLHGLGIRPRRAADFLTDAGPDWSPIFEGEAADEVLVREQQQQRALAAEKWIRHQSIEALDRAMDSKPMKLRRCYVGDLVLFQRYAKAGKRALQQGVEQAKTKGQGRWIGPAKVVGVDNSLIWVSFGGKLFICAPSSFIPSIPRR